MCTEYASYSKILVYNKYEWIKKSQEKKEKPLTIAAGYLYLYVYRSILSGTSVYKYLLLVL